MQLFINSERKEIQADQLNELLSEMGLLEKKGIAVAVNDMIIRKANWATHRLTENDNVLIITAAAGG